VISRRPALRAGATALAVASLLAVTACGDDENESTGSAAANSGGERLSIGIVPFAGADPTSNNIVLGVQDAAEERGWETSVIDAQGAPDKAVGAMQNLVQKNVDVIVTTVFPPDSLAGGVAVAKAAGIPVVSAGGGTGDGVQGDWDLGTEPGKAVSGQMVEDTGGEGNLLILGYTPGVPCRKREAGLDSALAGAAFDQTRQEVPIPGQVEGASKLTQAWLASHPAGAKNTIWACFDDPAMGAISALKAAGRKDVKVYGINGTPQALRAVKSGDLEATVWIDAYGTGTQLAEGLPEIVDNGVDGPAIENAAPSVLVTGDTVDQFLSDNPQALEG
jgi:ribose transport system substrate-binding protein